MSSPDDPKNAQDWIASVEGEGGRVRDGDIYPMLRAWVDRVSPARILEIGCGQGICSDKIDLSLRHYAGIDLSPLLVARAKALYSSGNRSFELGDAYALPYLDGAFDAVFSVAVWHLLGDLEKASAELGRVLKSGGSFWIVSANPGAYSAWTGRYEETRLEGRRLEGKNTRADGSIARDVLYLHLLDEIAGSLAGAGLHVEKSETFRSGAFVSIEGRKI